MKNLYVDNTPYPGHHTGTAQAGANNPPRITLAASCSEADDAYIDWGLRIVSGTGAGQSRRIVDYHAASRIAQVAGSWNPIPDQTSVYEVTFGCDMNMGLYQILGEGGPFASIQRAMEMVDYSDTVYVKAGTPYTWDNGQGAHATIQTAGMLSLQIRVVGYKDEPGDADDHWGDEAYQAVIDAGHTLANAINVDPSLSEEEFLGYEFSNFRFINSTEAGMKTGGEGFNLAAIALYNCRAEGNDGHGFDLGAGSQVVGCQANGNGGHGIYMEGGSHVIACLAHDNGGDQIHGSGLVEFTVVYGIPDGMAGISLFGAGNSVDSVRNCVIDGTLSGGANTGVSFQSVFTTLVNSIIYQCTVGVAQDSALKCPMARNNLYHGNATDRQDWPADRTGAVIGDPKFVDAEGHDYRLRADSPAAGAGWPAYLDLGAYQREGLSGCGSPTNVGMQV